MRLKYRPVFSFSFSTPWLLFALILLSLSAISSANIFSSSTPVMASVEDNQGEDDEGEKNTGGDDDEGNDNDDDINLDEMNLLQICCAWSDKISDGV